MSKSRNLCLIIEGMRDVVLRISEDVPGFNDAVHKCREEAVSEYMDMMTISALAGSIAMAYASALLPTGEVAEEVQCPPSAPTDGRRGIHGQGEER